MIKPKDLGLFSGPPLQRPTITLVLGLHVFVGGIVWFLLSHEDYAWAIILGGLVIALSGSFKLSAPEGKNV